MERFALLVCETHNGHSVLLDLTSNYFEGWTFVDVDVGNIKMDLWECMDWIDLAQDMFRWRALVNAVMNLRFS